MFTVNFNSEATSKTLLLNVHSITVSFIIKDIFFRRVLEYYHVLYFVIIWSFYFCKMMSFKISKGISFLYNKMWKFLMFC